MMLIFKSLHIIFVVTWFAALFYMPRLFIYQTEAHEKPEPDRSILTNQFKIMAKRLWFTIGWPSAGLVIIFGLGMAHPFFHDLWFWIKMVLVAGLLVYHHIIHFTYKKLQKDIYKYTSHQLRTMNEVATIFLFAIVFIAVFKNGINYFILGIGIVALMVLLYLGISGLPEKARTKRSRRSMSMSKKVPGFLMIFFITLACSETHEDRLPILGRREIKNVEVNGVAKTDTIYHTVADFKFVDQDSNYVTNNTFKGQIYVADFFFTTCPTICPVMQSNMLKVYKKYEDNPQVAFISYSIDPTYDTVPVLKDYAERLGINSKKWHLVTGDRDKIYDLGQHSYMVTAQSDSTVEGGYLHSGAFLLVDKQRRIRGLYDGTKNDDISQLTEDIGRLLKE